MNANPSAEITTVGIQKNKILKVGLLRPAAKNSQNSNPAMIQKSGERKFPMEMSRKPLGSVAIAPVEFGMAVEFDMALLRNSKLHTVFAMNIAASPLRMPLTRFMAQKFST